MRFGSLFAGIGGFDLGLERAGMECAWQVEIDPFCRRVLAKHWPDVPRYEDVREVGADNLESVELICGGFPCQDISNAGKRAGIEGERSGLWTEYKRVVCELRPDFVVVENVAALLARGIDVVLRDLAEIGYDAEWDTISAAAVGAPHLRERVWIVAYPQSERQRPRISGRGVELDRPETRRNPTQRCEAVADAYGPRLQGLRAERTNSEREATDRHARPSSSCGRGQWDAEPDVGRVANGVPRRVDRIRGLGNAVVPQVVEWIGRRILEGESAR